MLKPLCVGAYHTYALLISATLLLGFTHSTSAVHALQNSALVAVKHVLIIIRYASSQLYLDSMLRFIWHVCLCSLIVSLTLGKERG